MLVRIVLLASMGLLAGCSSAGLTCSGDWEKETAKDLAFETVIDELTLGTLDEAEMDQTKRDAAKNYDLSLDAIRTLSEQDTYVECVANFNMDAGSSEARTMAFKLFYTVYLTDKSDIYLEIDGMQAR